MDVRELPDRQEIVDLIPRDARAVDTRSWRSRGIQDDVVWTRGF